jgi:sugar lactone lactonase YvrE
MVQVFLNGKLLFTGNSAYRSRSPSFTGIVGLNDALHLPLRKGENELMLLVGETFGGWGFMCRDGSACFQHDDLTKLWELPQGFNYPESAVYDRTRDRLYVSNYFSGGVEFISKVKLSGEIENLKWISGLSRPTGLCIMGDTLFAIDRGGLVEIDIESGSVLQRHEIPGARFPNDVAADRKGNLYVSDGERDVIFQRRDGAFSVWLESEEIKDPNGLYVDQGRLLVGTSSDGCLKSVDLDTREIRTITSLGKGSIMDGVKADGKGNYIISDYSGRVFRVTPEGKKTKLLDTTAQSVNSADRTDTPSTLAVSSAVKPPKKRSSTTWVRLGSSSPSFSSDSSRARRSMDGSPRKTSACSSACLRRPPPCLPACFLRA